MKSIINKLYYGEISPCSKAAPVTKKSTENREKIRKAEEQLVKLYPDCKELLATYTEGLLVESQLESEADFARGFRLGALIMYEILSDDV